MDTNKEIVELLKALLEYVENSDLPAAVLQTYVLEQIKLFKERQKANA